MVYSEVLSLQWEGIPALELHAGGYSALAVPGLGGHLISFEETGTSYLRKPHDLAEYLLLPEAFGVPVLFPPNRIADCRFQARGIDYLLPANKEGHEHFHGFLYQRPWQVDKISAINGSAELEMSFTSPAEGEIFRWFPHSFHARLKYRLEESGLFQTITFENTGDRPMPFMLGFHTAFSLPDRKDDPGAYRIYVALGDELGELKDGNYINGDVVHPAKLPMKDFCSGRVLNRGEEIFGQFLAGTFSAGDKTCCGALIENRRTGKKLRYQTDKQFGYWVLWNQNGNDSFLCIEPQTCAINAANMHREEDRYGFKMLEAGAVFNAVNSFTVSGD